MALLEVLPASMQRSMCVRSAWACSAAVARLISAPLWIAELDPARLGDGQGKARALADHVSHVLGGSGEHVKGQPVCSRHAGNRKIEATAIRQRRGIAASSAPGLPSAYAIGMCMIMR
jgi:hypothetical protein